MSEFINKLVEKKLIDINMKVTWKAIFPDLNGTPFDVSIGISLLTLTVGILTSLVIIKLYGQSSTRKTKQKRIIKNQCFRKEHALTNFNSQLSNLDSDFLYHIGFSSEDPLKEMFSDVKFVILGGSANRMAKFAKYIAAEIGHAPPTGHGLVNLSSTDRYAMYKAGPVLAVNHGMGMPSISIILHEVTKLLNYAEATDLCYIRIGTSGGIGVQPGTVVLSEGALSADFEPAEEKIVLGKKISRPAHFDDELRKEIMEAWDEDTPCITGKTIATHDFYEGQGRLDGAICGYNEAEKMAYLREAKEHGVRNIEMEGLTFAAFCYHLNIPSAMAAVTLLNRLNGDQVPADGNTLKEYSERPIRLITKFVKRRLAANAVNANAKVINAA